MVSLTELRSRLYEAYDSQHTGGGGSEAAALIYCRDIRPLWPPPAAGPIVDPGCGRGELVRLLHSHIVTQNLTFAERAWVTMKPAES